MRSRPDNNGAINAFFEDGRVRFHHARLAARGAADAEMLAAEASQKRYAVEAEGKRATHEADNILSKEQIAMQVKLAIIKYLPEITRESVKPMEKIDSMKIVQVDGLTGGNAGHGGGASGNGPNLADQLVNSALRYRAQAPILDGLLKEIGLDGSTLSGLTAGASGQDPPKDG